MTNMEVARIAGISNCALYTVWMDDDLEDRCCLVSYGDLMDELKG